jgi:hypothetical protein
MKFSTLLKRPIRFSAIAIVISIAVYLVTSTILRYLDSIIFAQNELRCRNVPNCFQVASVPMQILHTIVWDFRSLAEYAVEITVLFVIAQIIYRVVKRSKNSKLVH